MIGRDSIGDHARTQPAVLQWEIPEASLCVRIRSGALNRLVEESSSGRPLDRRDFRTAGILLGRMTAGSRNTIFVEDYQGLPADANRTGVRESFISRKALNELTERWNSGIRGRMDVVGCYFVDPGADMSLPRFQRLYRDKMPADARFGLLLSRTSDLKASGAFLFNQAEVPDGVISWEYSRRPVAESNNLPSAKTTPLHPVPGRFAIRIRAVVLAIGIGAIFMVYGIMSRRPPAPAHAEPVIAAPPPGLKPKLNAVLTGRTINISWGQERMAAPPESGFIQIQDGARQRTVPIEDIHQPGQIIYVPRTDDVQVWLRSDSGNLRPAGYVRIFNATADGEQPDGAPDLDAAGRRLARQLGAALHPPENSVVPLQADGLDRRSEKKPAVRTDLPLTAGSPGLSAASTSPGADGARVSDIASGSARNAKPSSPVNLFAEPSLRVPMIAGERMSIRDVAEPPTLPPAPAPAPAFMRPDLPGVGESWVRGPQPSTGHKAPELAVISPAAPLVQPRVNPVASTETPTQFHAAVPIRSPQPAWRAEGLPAYALERPLEIGVEVTISATGHVTRARLAGHVGPYASTLAASALNTARSWTFHPATLGSRPVESQVVINFHYSHRD